jgi:hypothetical protein
MIFPSKNMMRRILNSRYNVAFILLRIIDIAEKKQGLTIISMFHVYGELLQSKKSAAMH